MSLTSDLQEFLDEQFILVVEPTMNYRFMLKDFLMKLGIENFKIVGSVGDVKREMLTKKFGFIISEWKLPEKNGLEFCRDLRKDKRYRNTPFLLTSTDNLDRDVILASEGGVSGYLLKPFSYQEFCAQLKQILHHESNPTELESLLERAESYFENKEYWVAEALFRDALTLKPTSARASCGLGRVELHNGNADEALKHFKKAIEFNRHYIEAYKLKLQVAEKQFNNELVLQSAMELHNLSPDNPKYPLIIATAHMETGDYKTSEQYFRKAVRVSPSLAAGYRGLGTVYLMTKDYPLAQKNFEKALDLEPGDAATLNSLGLAFVRQNMLDQGIKKYLMALHINPHDARVLFNLGLAYEAKNNLVEARDVFMRSIEKDPGSEKAHRSLERVLRRLASGEIANSVVNIEENEDLPATSARRKKGA